MTYNGEKVWKSEEFLYENAQVGDYVDAEVVDDAMSIIPPACMRSDCSQLGEPYSHRQDPDTGVWRPTFRTFKCVSQEHGIWMYCGNCFRGESVERGNEPVYC